MRQLENSGLIISQRNVIQNGVHVKDPFVVKLPPLCTCALSRLRLVSKLTTALDGFTINRGLDPIGEMCANIASR